MTFTLNAAQPGPSGQTTKCQKQFLEWPIEARSKSVHVKMLNFRAEINMLTAWYKKGFRLYT